MGAYDLIVIGGGAAGLAAADVARKLGARVGLIEKSRIGGDLLWSGTVPTKALLKTAGIAHQMRRAGRYGLAPVQPVVDLRSVLAAATRVSSDMYTEVTPEMLRQKGIDVFSGDPHFRDLHTVALNGETLTSDFFLVASGAHPEIPALPGLNDTEHYTYDSIWQMQVLPEHLLVLGSGSIACELAQAYRRLGSRVTLLTDDSRLLPGEEPEASQLLAGVFAAEGIDLRLDTRIERVWDSPLVHLATPAGELVGDALLLAIGRLPNVHGIGLEEIGVEHDKNGVRVNSHMCTSKPNIYAAGDCTGSHQSTHYAEWQAFTAVSSMLMPTASEPQPTPIPTATFTDPEVARVGMTEEKARSTTRDVSIHHVPMAEVHRALAERETEGFLKVVHRHNGAVLGATAVCSHAGEIIHEWSIVLEHQLNAADLAGVVHLYPTYSMANMQAAISIRLEKLMGGLSQKIIEGLARLMR